MVSEWQCSKCVHWMDVNVYVLACGHFLCSDCYTVKKNLKNLSIRSGFQCEKAGCNEGTRTKYLGDLPLAKDIMYLREKLRERGIPCSTCVSPKYHYPPEFIYISKTGDYRCIKANIEYEFSSDSIRAGDGSVLRIPHWCLWCKHKEDQSTLECIWYTDNLTRALRKTQDKLSHADLKDPWHLVLLTDIDTFIKLFECKRCGDEYGASGSFPVMLDCSCVVCNDCEEKSLRHKVPCCNRTTKERYSMAEGKNTRKLQRRIADLQFLCSEDRSNYKLCETCKKRHPGDNMNKRDANTFEQPAICVFCAHNNDSCS